MQICHTNLLICFPLHVSVVVYFVLAKIRRLYDIANILASLNLICKVHVTELRGRKPAFSYIGPDVEELSSLDGKLMVLLWVTMWF